MKLINDAQEAFGKPVTPKLTLYRPKKDLPTNSSGYKGRMGVYEVLYNSTDIQKLIVANGTSEEIGCNFARAIDSAPRHRAVSCMCRCQESYPPLSGWAEV